MKNLRVLLFCATFPLWAACAHMHPVEGPQAAEQIPAGVRVRIGASEVKEGQKVSVFKSVCRTTERAVRGNEVRRCSDQKVGEARVVKVLDHDSAVVQPEDGAVIDESMTVEKQ